MNKPQQDLVVQIKDPTEEEADAGKGAKAVALIVRGCASVRWQAKGKSGNVSDVEDYENLVVPAQILISM
jgi:uncharacterized membrane protein